MSLDPVFEPIKLGAHTVPGLWRYMFPDDVMYFRVDPETKSSCFNCPQVKAAGFHPSVRCCTVIPRVPNFLLGMALFDSRTEPMITDYIAKGYVLPEGCNISPSQLSASLSYIVKPDRDKPTVICPFLNRESKACRLYSYRTTVCSTFFCHHDRGDEGRIFWEDLQDLGSQIEAALGQWALGEVGFDVASYFNRFNSLGLSLDSSNDPGSDAWSESSRKLLFGDWYGREGDLFKRCADVVIAHKDQLYAIACRQNILQTATYDEATRKELLKNFPAYLVSEALPEGTPETIQSLWYSVQLSHRNLQLSRQS
ncbi:MAG: hypothetical protein H7249_09505 [Chitinophagaceae bacterium]|nr:hypothetical protein [Oligoflexus sp.]